MKKYLLATLAIIVTIAALRMSTYTVDAGEYAYVTVLGAHSVTHDGAAEESGAGLHFGLPWPVQAVQRLDRRLQQFDLPATELLTHDPGGKTIDKMLLVEAYVTWRIGDRDSVDLFVRRIGTVERASAILEPRVRSELGAAIGQLQMDDLVSTDIDAATGKTRVDVTVESLHAKLRENLTKRVREEYGIELVDIRLRRFSHPSQVREAIFARIRSERKRKETDYEEEGKKQKRKIEDDADEAASKIRAEARAAETKIKGDADALAMRIRNEAHQKDPKYYEFLKQMEKLQAILGDNRTVLLLSTNRPLFERLFIPPLPQGAPKKDTAPDEKKVAPDKTKGVGQ